MSELSQMSDATLISQFHRQTSSQAVPFSPAAARSDSRRRQTQPPTTDHHARTLLRSLPPSAHAHSPIAHTASRSCPSSVDGNNTIDQHKQFQASTAKNRRLENPSNTNSKTSATDRGEKQMMTFTFKKRHSRTTKPLPSHQQKSSANLPRPE